MNGLARACELTFVFTQVIILQGIERRGRQIRDVAQRGWRGWDEPLTPFDRRCDRMSLTIS